MHQRTRSTGLTSSSSTEPMHSRACARPGAPSARVLRRALPMLPPPRPTPHTNADALTRHLACSSRKAIHTPTAVQRTAPRAPRPPPPRPTTTRRRLPPRGCPALMPPHRAATSPGPLATPHTHLRACAVSLRDPTARPRRVSRKRPMAPRENGRFSTYAHARRDVSTPFRAHPAPRGINWERIPWRRRALEATVSTAGSGRLFCRETTERVPASGGAGRATARSAGCLRGACGGLRDLHDAWGGGTAAGDGVGRSRRDRKLSRDRRGRSGTLRWHSGDNRQGPGAPRRAVRTRPDVQPCSRAAVQA